MLRDVAALGESSGPVPSATIPEEVRGCVPLVARICHVYIYIQLSESHQGRDPLPQSPKKCVAALPSLSPLVGRTSGRTHARSPGRTYARETRCRQEVTSPWTTRHTCRAVLCCGRTPCVPRTSQARVFWRFMCGGSEAGSYLRLIDFVYHSL